MPDRVAIPRHRLLNFRLTDEEYDQLRHASVEHGARGLSDFARSILFSQIDALSRADRHAPCSANILNDRLAALEAAVDRLVQALDRFAHRDQADS